MSFTLEIRFDGLCLFVQRQQNEAERGLHVLFPKHHGHLLRVKVGSEPDITALGIEDLCKPGNSNAVPVPIAGAISMKKATEKGTVPQAMLEGGLHSSLAARFRLPFPDREPDLFTENVGARAVRKSGSDVPLGRVAGTVIMSFTFSEPIMIGPVKFDTSGQIIVANAPASYYSQKHDEDVILLHAPAYIPLVTGGTYEIKEFRTTAKYEPKPKDPDIALIESAKAIDPVDCTVGTGCPYDEPDCGYG
jgi:hypothetical protein